jgi:hypothetical protein
MIVLDTNIVTLISYGHNEKLRKRIEKVPGDEELAVTCVWLFSNTGADY